MEIASMTIPSAASYEYLAKTTTIPPLTNFVMPSFVTNCQIAPILTHWGRVTHICVSKPTIIGSDNGVSPGRRQAIIWTNDGILLIGPLGTNFSEILIEIYTFSFNKMHLKMSSGKWRPFCLGLNVLNERAVEQKVELQVIWRSSSHIVGAYKYTQTYTQTKSKQHHITMTSQWVGWRLKSPLSLRIVYSTVYPGADQRKTPKPCVTGLYAGNSPGPVNSPHKRPVTRKLFLFDDVIMSFCLATNGNKA